jgi:DamX protein
MLVFGIGGAISLYAHSQAQRAALAQQIERLTEGQHRLTAELEVRGRAPDPPATSAPAVVPTAPITAVSPPADTQDAVPSATITRVPTLSLVVDPRGTAPPPDVAPTTDVALEIQPQTVTVTDRPFALQLNGSHSQENIRKLAARPNLPAQVYILTEIRRGRPWYVLIHSLHGSVEDARQALAQLPSDLRSRSPWIRALPPGTSLDISTTRASRP